MNKIVDRFLLAGDKFMPEVHLRQPGFTNSACRLLTKNKKRIQKFKETGDSRYIYENKLDKACFQHDMVYRDFKDLTRKTASDKIMCDKPFHIAKNTQYDGYQRGLASMVYKFFDNFLIKSISHAQSEILTTRDKSTSGGAGKNGNMSNLRKFTLEIYLTLENLRKVKYTHLL